LKLEAACWFSNTKSTPFFAAKVIITSTITPQITIAAITPPEIASALPIPFDLPPQLLPEWPLKHKQYDAFEVRLVEFEVSIQALAPLTFLGVVPAIANSTQVRFTHTP